MKVLVTGGAGFIGSVLVPMLLAEGHRVRVYDNLMFGLSGIFGCFNDPGFEFIEGDIRDKSSLKKAVDGCDAIVHLAAHVGFPICKQDPDEAWKVNVLGTRILTEVIENDDVPLIFASTGSVYGKLSEVCTEESPTEPLTIYGKSKLKAESWVRRRENSIIMRFATAFGISPRVRLDLLINDFCYKAVHERNLIVYEKSYKRTFLYVNDMCKSFLFALENFDNMKTEIFNVGDESMNCSKEDIAELIRKKTDYYLHYVESDDFHDEDERNYSVSYKKINDLGFETEISIEAGIDRLLEFFQYFDVKKEFSNA